MTPRQHRQRENQQRVDFHVEAGAERTGDPLAPGEPSVHAVEQGDDDAGGDRRGRDRRQLRLADEAGDQRHEDRAKGGDLIRRAKTRERMVLLKESDGQAHDDGEQSGGLQRIAIPERQRRACHVGERNDGDEPDEF